jgi:spore coat polysaccharide biosynthesis protein SpsF
MKIGAIIFSRMSSKRLPGKAFVDIEGKTLLERVVERTKLIKQIDHFCIATSIKKEDDAIESFAYSNNIDLFRGDLNDVAGRGLDAAKHFGYNHFLRVCGDRPFLDSKIYDDLISVHLQNANDLTTNIFPRKVPPGLTGEVINTNALERVHNLTSDYIDREHVTRYFYRNPDFFKIKNVETFDYSELNDIRLVIDNLEDLIRAKWILNKLKKQGKQHNTNNILSLAKQWKNKTIKT